MTQMQRSIKTLEKEKYTAEEAASSLMQWKEDQLLNNQTSAVRSEILSGASSSCRTNWVPHSQL